MKYTFDYAKLYAALWAFGYETLNLGGTEGLYRTIFDLGTKHLKGASSKNILEIGCGVGRSIRDFANYYPEACIYGFDRSESMIEVATMILLNPSSGMLSVDLNNRGFGEILVPCNNLENVELWQSCFTKDTKLEKLNGKCDLLICSNVLDRVDDIDSFLNRIGLLLSPKGGLILITPANWQSKEAWKRFYSHEDIFKVVEQCCKINIKEHFYNVPYIEILDRNGAHERYDLNVIYGYKNLL